MIQCKVHISQLEAFNERLLAYVHTKALLRAQNAAVRSINTLTRQGVDAYGVMFKPYRPYTVRQRTMMGLRTDIVNLYVTGRMLGSLGSNGNPDGTVTFSADQLQKAIDNILLDRTFIAANSPYMTSTVKNDVEEGVRELQ